MSLIDYLKTKGYKSTTFSGYGGVELFKNDIIVFISEFGNVRIKTTKGIFYFDINNNLENIFILFLDSIKS